MISLKFIRENPELVLKNLEKRQNPDILELYDQILKLDVLYRDALQKVEKMNCKRNDLVKQISIAKKNNEDIDELLKESKNLPKKIDALQAEVDDLKNQLDTKMMSLPNLLHESVPYGKDDTENVVVDEYKVKPKTKLAKYVSHVDILSALDLADLDRAAKISGARFYFLKNDLALLDMALQRYAVDFMMKKDYSFVMPPFMINRKSVEGVTDLAEFEDVIYKIDKEDLYMISTSEHPLTAMYQDEIFDENQLPIKMLGLSQCFRKEAGAHGKDTKGIFRVHQFTKVEQIVICTPEESWHFHEEMIKNARDFWKTLEIPFRQVNICTGDIGIVASKKYDLEAWMPAQNSYREIVSCSNCTDYQANRLKMRYRTNEDKKQVNKAVHTLNSTLCATTRALVAILENCQDEDGNIKIPKVLVPYMNGMTSIKKKEKKAEKNKAK